MSVPLEIWFYHLESWSLERALPALLEKSRERGWRAVVQTSSQERVDSLDLALWTYDDASFLPHGTARDGDASLQPIYLTDTATNPNGAAIRFLVDGADIASSLAEDPGTYARIVLLFDGRAQDDIESARRQWSSLKSAGHAVSYWQQNEDGRWEKRA